MGLVAVRPLERSYQQRVLPLPQRQVVDRGGRWCYGILTSTGWRGGGQQPAQFGRVDRLVAAEHEQPLHEVLELPYVSRPVMRAQEGERRRGERTRGPAQFGGESIDECADQRV